jgi:hypothetical protein
VGVTNCTGSGYTPPIRQKINNAAYVKNNYNDAEYKGFRAALTYQIDPDWSIDVMHMRQKLTSDGVFDYQPDIGDLKVHKFGPNTLKDNFDVTTLNINGRIGALTVLYAGSYVHHEAQQTADYSGYSNVGLYLLLRVRRGRLLQLAEQCGEHLLHAGQVVPDQERQQAPDQRVAHRFARRQADPWHAGRVL